MIHFQFLGPGAHGYLVKTFHVSSILSIQTPYKAGYSSLAGQVLLLFVWWVIWNGRWQKEQWWGLSSTLETALKSKSPAGQHFLVSQASLHRTLMSTFPALQANYCCLVTQSRLALATSWAVARQALSVGFPRWEQWSGLSFPSEDLPDPGMEPASPALQANSLPLSHQGSPFFKLRDN